MAESTDDLSRSARRTDYQCEYCAYSSERRYNVERHFIRIHTKRISKLCCGQRFRTKGTYYQHISEEHGERGKLGWFRRKQSVLRETKVENKTSCRRSSRIRDKRRKKSKCNKKRCHSIKLTRKYEKIVKNNGKESENCGKISDTCKKVEKILDNFFGNSNENLRIFGEEFSKNSEHNLSFENLAKNSREKENLPEIIENKGLIDDSEFFVDNAQLQLIEEEVASSIVTDPTDFIMWSLNANGNIPIFSEQTDQFNSMFQGLLKDSNDEENGVKTEENPSIFHGVFKENQNKQLIHPKKGILRKYLDESSTLDDNKENIELTSSSMENSMPSGTNSQFSAIQSKKIRFSLAGNEKMAGLSPLRDITEAHRSYLSAFDFEQFYEHK